MTPLPYAALITLLAIAVMFWTALNVGRARATYDVKAPATSGHEMFDRAYRVQMNTMESALMLLPALWVYAAFIGDMSSEWYLIAVVLFTTAK